MKNESRKRAEEFYGVETMDKVKRLLYLVGVHYNSLHEETQEALMDELYKTSENCYVDGYRNGYEDGCETGCSAGDEAKYKEDIEILREGFYPGRDKGSISLEVGSNSNEERR